MRQEPRCASHSQPYCPRVSSSRLLPAHRRRSHRGPAKCTAKFGRVIFSPGSFASFVLIPSSHGKVRSTSDTMHTSGSWYSIHSFMSDVALDFWFDFASTYSYPAALRIRSLARQTGVIIRFRPFLLGPIFKAQGWQTASKPGPGVTILSRNLAAGSAFAMLVDVWWARSSNPMVKSIGLVLATRSALKGSNRPVPCARTAAQEPAAASG